MSNTTPTTYMGLPNPNPTVDPGPDYANNLYACNVIVDQHNHSPGSGQQITPSGLNINSNLTLNANNLTSVRTVNFVMQNAPIPGSAPDLGALYVAGNELYYNDEVGNQVQITLNGSVNAAAGSITGLVPPASAQYFGGTFIFQSNVNTAANLDGENLILRLGTASSPGLTLSPPNTLSGGSYTLTLPAVPSVPSILGIDTFGNIAPAPFAGIIVAYGGTSAPAGWLMCDGTSYLQSAYPGLFAVIGTAYGSADSSHFNVPDLRGQFVRGTDNGAGNDPDSASRTNDYPGQNTGDNVGSVQAYAVQDHIHNETATVAPAQAGTSGYIVITQEGSFQTAPNSYQNMTNLFTAGVHPEAGIGISSGETRPLNVYANYIIKT